MPRNRLTSSDRSRWHVTLAALVLPFWCAGLALAANEAGSVTAINGTPTVMRGTATAPLKRGDTVLIGDRIETDATAEVKVLLADDSVLAIGPRSQVTIDELVLEGGARKGRLDVLVGRFKLAIADWLSGSSDYEVRTPTAIAGVRGTVLWGDTELDAICALRGHVQVRTVRGSAVAELDPGRCVTHMSRGETEPLVPSREDLDKYLREVTID